MRARSAQIAVIAATLVMCSLARAQDTRDEMASAERAWKQGDASSAISIYERVLKAELKPRDRATCLAGLADAYRYEGRYRDSATTLEARHAIILDLRFARNTTMLDSAMAVSDAWLEAGELNQSEQWLDSALQSVRGPLSPATKLAAEIRLAQVARMRGSSDVQRQRWLMAEATAKQLRDLIERGFIRADQKRRCLTSLAEIYASTERGTDALQVLNDLLAMQREEKDVAAQVSTLKTINQHYVLMGQFEEAANTLRAALDLQSTNPAASDTDRASILSSLADLERRLNRRDAARGYSRQVIDVLEAAGLDRLERLADSRKMEHWRQLRNAYQDCGQVANAIQYGELLEAHHRKAFGAKSEPARMAHFVLGNLYYAAGKYEQALPILNEKVAFSHERQNLLEEATDLINLGATELSLDQLDIAEEHFQSALRIRQTHLAADDLLIAAAHNSLANVLSKRGRFSDAVAAYEHAITICDIDSNREAELKATILLNLAVTYKLQHQLTSAVQYAQRALDERKRHVAADSMMLAGHYNLLADLCRENGRQLQRSGQTTEAGVSYKQAQEYASDVVEICQRKNELQHPQAAAALNTLAIVNLYQRKFSEAQAQWERSLEIYEQAGAVSRRVDVLNYLGAVCYLDQRFDEAETFFTRADTLGRERVTAPLASYSTLCNLAAICRHREDWDGAIEYLERAIALIEAPRSSVYGAERERAEFLAQFRHSFDVLFDCYIEKGDYRRAFSIAELARNRTFLEELQLSGVNLIETLPGPEGDALRNRELAARKRINTLRYTAESSSEGISAEDIDKVRREVLDAQREYATVWREIRNSSPVYRNLLTRDQQLLSLDDLQRAAQELNAWVLMYFVGSERSHLLVVRSKQEPLVFPVTLPAKENAEVGPEVSLAAKPANQDEMDLVNEPTRGLVGLVSVEKGDLVEEQKTRRRLSVPRADLDTYVHRYLKSLEKQSYDRALGRLLARTLLPPALIRLIHESQPKRLVVIRDGPLNDLPFETLLLADHPDPIFVIDDSQMPPITYSPSANILANLMQRAASAEGDTSPTLLSIGDPAYGDAKLKLRFAAEECAEITSVFGAHFGGQSTTLLQGSNATVDQAKAAIEQHQFLHFAAHGLIDEESDNLFAGIALAPENGSRRLYGLLDVSEIQRLQLSHCKVAILSACETNVGSERPLEAGASLARAFLVGGAHRVIASHWRVDDQSTSLLMKSFMQHVISDYESSGQPDYALALLKARREVRSNASFLAPHYWAPFVLIGPPR